ncbi:M13 family metallopeptidase [Flavobacteriaceae bacterium F08102]|nr:M13 family metallopeptidase [Flavobacteriaceae bacterium F08102]
MKFINRLFFISLCGVFALYSCKKESTALQDNLTHSIKTPGIVLENMDTTVSPKVDFYNYVNGTWMKNTKIPEDRTLWGGFSVLAKKTVDDVLAILSEAQTSGTYKPETDQAKALYIFESELDTVSRNKDGITPIQPALKAISEVKNLEDLQTLLMSNPHVTSPIINFTVFPNLANSKVYAGYIVPGKLGLPDRDFYILQDATSKEIRQKYVAYISKMLQILGDDETSAKKQATMILALETKLARPLFNKAESRDYRNYYNPFTVQQINEKYPVIQWDKLIKDTGIEKEVTEVIVMQPRYMEALQTILTSTPIEDLKALTRWTTFNSVAKALDTQTYKTIWEFYNKTLNGQKEMRPANERALATLDGAVGQAVGKLYVDKMFPPEAKAKAEEMINNIISAFKARINALDWMSDTTKIQAITKLNKIGIKIGYPDKWEDYSKLDVHAENSFYDNLLAIKKWNKTKNLANYGIEVDKTKWGMSPQTVNAGYNPLNNDITFPAAILQPPFYNFTADAAVNYGGIGAVIGHEISHAFDDSGARFDGDGNLKNWWTAKDLASFTERGKALADQYSAIEVLDSVYVDGVFTLGENIGDLGGVLGAYDGLQQYFAAHGRPDPIDGFTAEQRFFMSWTTIWRTLVLEETQRNLIKTDEHAPGKVRAVQPLLNMDAFYNAFDIKEGDPMYLAPEKRVRIW